MRPSSGPAHVRASPAPPADVGVPQLKNVVIGGRVFKLIELACSALILRTAVRFTDGTFAVAARFECAVVAGTFFVDVAFVAAFFRAAARVGVCFADTGSRWLLIS
jgi:hypothetical protein